jgi:Fe-S cluster assembly protein SufD
MPTLTTSYDPFASAIASIGDAPRWLADLRAAGAASFAELGMPTQRDEEWRFTDTAPLTAHAWSLPAASASVSAADIEPFSFGAIAAVRLVFIDGRYRADLSVRRSLPAGVTVLPLSEAMTKHTDLVRSRLGRIAPMERDGLTAMNTALITEGAFIHVAAGVELDAPIRLLYLHTAAGAPAMCHPRNLIVAEANSRCTIVESFGSLDAGPTLTNAVDEVYVGSGSRMQHYGVQRENERAVLVTTLRVCQDRDSVFESHRGLFGGALVRNNVEAELAGVGAHALLNGVFVPRNRQHFDNHMRVVHAAENCTSRQLYKGILADDATGVFAGRIIVNPGAQKTDALQTNRNLLLSDRAKVNTKPQLEIFADDVKCSHGATTGRIDDEAIYYLRARGLDAETARGLLVYAFAHESLDLMGDEPLRHLLERFLLERLPQRDKLAPLFD